MLKHVNQDIFPQMVFCCHQTTYFYSNLHTHMLINWPTHLFLTYYLKAPVFVKLSYVSRAEPPLAILIHKEVVLVFRFTLVVSHCYVWSTNHNLSSRTGLVCTTITTWKQGLISLDAMQNIDSENSARPYYLYVKTCAESKASNKPELGIKM